MTLLEITNECHDKGLYFGIDIRNGNVRMWAEQPAAEDPPFTEEVRFNLQEFSDKPQYLDELARGMFDRFRKQP